MTRRIAIVGPESTGKSSLSEHLAVHYQTLWVPEYAREYLEKNGLQYTYDDLLTIAKKQLELEDRYAEKVPSGYLFIDTNLYVMKIWCEFVFGKCHQWILDQIAKRHYDLYLLCNTDLPWEFQEMREYPELETRQKLFHMYKDNLLNQHVPWHIVAGTENSRLHMAVSVIDRLFAH